ncbi:MAG: hypothetical protein ACYC7E_09400 [Armatimonadota bacterium]
MTQHTNESEHNDIQSSVVSIDEDFAAVFLLEHLRNANLQRQGMTKINAPDHHFKSNEEFWDKLLHERTVTLRWVELLRFQIVDWFPRSPGLYHTSHAERARRDAERFVRKEGNISFYEPFGKSHMIFGGIGSVRFKPIQIGQEDYWLCTATSDGYVHSGIPIAIPNRLLQNIDFSNYQYLYNIIGQVKFLPRFLEEYFYHLIQIPQIYIQIDNIETQIEKDLLPVKITPMVFYTGEQLESGKSKINFWGRMEIGNVTYVTCNADSLTVRIVASYATCIALAISIHIADLTPQCREHDVQALQTATAFPMQVA